MFELFSTMTAFIFIFVWWKPVPLCCSSSSFTFFTEKKNLLLDQHFVVLWRRQISLCCWYQLIFCAPLIDRRFFPPLLLSRTWVLWQRSWGSWGWRKAADLLSRWSGDFTYCNKQLGLQTQAWSSNTTFNFSYSTPSSLSLDKSTNHSNTVWLFRSVFYSVIYVTSLTRSRPMRGEEGVSCRAVAFSGVVDWNCNRKY